MEYLSRVWSFLTQSSLQRQIAGLTPPQGYQEPPLITAAINGDIRLARDLLEKGADVSVKDYLHHMALHYAAMGGNVDMISLLLDYGADISAKAGREGSISALASAIASGKEDASKLLMAKGAVIGPGELSSYGMSHCVRWMPDHQFKQYQQSLIGTSDYISRLWTSLTQSPIQPEPSLGFKMPPLIMAVTTRDIQAAQDLCASGADVDAKDHIGYTSLHYAAMAGDVTMTSLLLDNGADIKIKAGHPEKSALSWAIVNKEESTAKVLMARGATSDCGELTEYEMASYMRWMPENMFKDYWRALFGPMGHLVDVK